MHLDHGDVVPCVGTTGSSFSGRAWETLHNDQRTLAYRDQTVLARCDNMAVVVIVNRRNPCILGSAWPFWKQKEPSTSVQNILEGRTKELQMLCPGITSGKTVVSAGRQSPNSHPGGSPGGVSSRTNHHQMDNTVAVYFTQGLAMYTRRTYGAAKRRYGIVCRKVGQPLLPTSKHRLCLFAANLTQEDLAHSSILGYMSAVRHLHVAAGLGLGLCQSWSRY